MANIFLQHDFSGLVKGSQPIAQRFQSKIYKATLKNEKNGYERDVAIEIYNPGVFKTAEEKKAFHDEMLIQSTIYHPCLHSALHFVIAINDEDSCQVVTPFMEHGDLGAFLREVSKGNAPENWPTIQSIIIFGIAAGMASLHQSGYIHRNLKPENVLLDSNYYPQITDYGLAIKYEEGKEQKLSVGTPIYMAPEVVDDVHYTNKIDVFSYGMILYHILTLRRPWCDKKDITTFKLLKLIIDGERPEIKKGEINDGWKDLIQRCWNNDPDKRPSFIQIVNFIKDNHQDLFDAISVDEEMLDDYIERVSANLHF